MHRGWDHKPTLRDKRRRHCQKTHRQRRRAYRPLRQRRARLGLVASALRCANDLRWHHRSRERVCCRQIRCDRRRHANSTRWLRQRRCCARSAMARPFPKRYQALSAQNGLRYRYDHSNSHSLPRSDCARRMCVVHRSGQRERSLHSVAAASEPQTIRQIPLKAHTPACMTQTAASDRTSNPPMASKRF